MGELSTSGHLIPISSHKVMRAVPANEEQMKALREAERQGALHFWTEHKRPGGFVDFRVPPTKLVGVELLLEQLGIKTETIIADLRP